MMYNTASSDNVQTRENVSSQSVQSLVDQMLQHSQKLQTQLSQNLQTLVELQTLVAKQQLSKGVVEVQAPTGREIAKHSTTKNSPKKALHCQSTLSSLLENPSQGLTEGGIRGGDIGGGGKTAGAGMPIEKTEELHNNKRICTGARTRSSVRAEVECATDLSWTQAAINLAVINQKRSHGSK